MNINNKYKNMMFLDADAGGGDGGGGEAIAGTGEISRGAAAMEPVAKQGTGERPLPAPKAPASSGPNAAPTEGAAPSPEPTPAAGGFDAEKFAKTFADSIAPVLQKGAEPAAPKMTPEEARKLLNTWEPDDDWYAKFGNLETQKDAVAMMRDALIRQADTLAQFRMNDALEKLRGEFMPHIQAMQQWADQQRDDRFVTKYPQLGDEKLRPLVIAVSEDLARQGKKFNSEAEAFAALANGVESVIKVNNPDFKLTEASSNGGGQSQSGQPSRSLPVTSPGASGGTGRQEGGGKKAEPRRGMAIFQS